LDHPSKTSKAVELKIERAVVFLQRLVARPCFKRSFSQINITEYKMAPYKSLLLCFIAVKQADYFHHYK
jgi:hypothetical protein